MKRTKLMLGTMVLAVGMAGAAWAQPAPNHEREANTYSTRGNVNRARGDQDDHTAWRGNSGNVYSGGYNSPYTYQRGDGDHDRDDNRGTWGARDRRDNRNVWSDRDSRGSWNWGHSDMRRGKRDDR